MHIHTHAHILKDFGLVLVIVYKIKKNHFILLSTYGELLLIENWFFLNPRKDNKCEVAKNFRYVEIYVWDKYIPYCSDTHSNSEMSLVEKKTKKLKLLENDETDQPCD